MYQKRKAIENILIVLIDIYCIWISLSLAFGIRYRVFIGIKDPGDQLWQIALISLLYGFINVLTDFNGYFFRKGYFEDFISVVRNQMFFSILWIMLLFLIHRSSHLSRLVYGYFIVINILLTFIGRSVFKLYMLKIYKTSKYSNRLLVVTTSEEMDTVIKSLNKYKEWSYILVGAAITDKPMIGKMIDGVPVVADQKSLLDYIVRHNVDEVFINNATKISGDFLEELVFEMERMGVIVDVNIDIFEFTSREKKSLSYVGKYAVIMFARNLFSTRQIIAKRILDIVGSIVGMFILGVITIFVALAIKMESPGPVFFGQTRIGKNGRRFTFYKFRSMYQDAEQRKKELMKKNEIKGLMFKLEDDPRITKVGKFIRRTSIDELPQFWNVLKGDMSLVGTRPPTVDEFERYEARHKCRLSMTPGLTGLWQISGRSDIKDFEEVVKLDMQYIDNWSILKDINILSMTVWVVLTGKGSR